MTIRLSIIRPDVLGQVRNEVEELRSSVNAGDMDGVDAATTKLVALTAVCQSVDLTEGEWRVFLDGIRKKNPEFRSSYLLPGEVCSEILPTVSASDFVLELPIDEEFGKGESNV